MSLTAPIIGGKGTATLSEAVFGVEVSPGLLHEVAKAEAAGQRQGTHATKTRGMVAGGRAKPFRQKGTGRARQGTTRAAQFTGGGAVFGPQPRSYAVKVNKKAYRKARCMGLSQHAALGSLGVFDASAFAEPKTKDALKLVDGWIEAPLVVVVGSEEEAAALSFRNIPRSAVLTPTEVDLTSLLWAQRLLLSETALAELTAALDGAREKAEVAA
jgi:large subunit ribosomal protein L4